MTLTSPGYVDTNFTEHVTSLGVAVELEEMRRTAALPPDVDIGEIVLRATAVG